MGKDMNISVVIPAYNEEKRIRATLKKIIKYLENNSRDYEIIIVNDCSRDKTLEVIGEFKNSQINVISNSRNMGKGFSVKRGMLAANKEWVLFSDADLSTPIEELAKFDTKSGYDIFIGSRNMKDSKILIRQPFLRSKLGKIFPFIVSMLVLSGIKDTQCGFKMFSRKSVQKIFKKQRMERFSFDVEVLYLARKCGFKIKETPIVWVNSDQSKVNIFKDVPNMFMDLIRIKLNDWSGRYDKEK